MSHQDGPLDERAALIELERFRQDIERYRVQRQTLGQDFDRFIQSFPSPDEVFPTESAPPRLPPRSEAPALPLPPVPRRTVPEPVPPAASSEPFAPIPAVIPQTQPPEPAAAAIPRIETEHPTAAIAPPPSRRSTRTLSIAIIVVVLAAAAALATWSFRQQRQPAAPAADRVEAPSPSPTPPPAAPAAAPAPILESEITTLRPAWVRVTADGERVVERELAANARISFNAEKTILIRTGDAGAVRLSIRGKDQGTLGRDGAVVTRSFDVPPTPPR